MHQVGLLILTAPLRAVLDSIGHHLSYAAQTVHKRLYIKFEPGFEKLWPLPKRNQIDLQLLSKFVPEVYIKAAACGKDIDVRVLLAFSKNSNIRDVYLSSNFDVVLTDSSDSETSIKHYVHKQFNKICPAIIKLQKSEICLSEDKQFKETAEVCVYDTIVLGGTFDRLHSGHKVLLSDAVLRTAKKLIVGVTDGEMLKGKVLWELIEPASERINHVTDFLKDIEPSIEYSVVPITDAFGPSIQDPNIDCIVVSDETMKGGHKVNCERSKRGMKELAMHMTSLVEDPHRDNVLDELKVSSSSIRRRLLGSYIRQPETKAHLSGAVRIALIGGSMSGKSCISRIMQSLGAEVIDIDRTISTVLAPRTALYEQVVQEFGQERLVESDGSINTKHLGFILLKDENKREFLDRLFLEARPIIEKSINHCEKQGASVVVLKMPPIVQAHWLRDVHQVWATIIPESETIRRLKECYKISEKEASKILSIQASNVEMVQQAHVVFSPNWEPQVTKNQVQTAWIHLQKCLKSAQSESQNS